MTKIELAKKVLSEIEEQTIVYTVWSYEGGACGDGWCDTVHDTYSAAILRGMIKEQIHSDELFEGLEVSSLNGLDDNTGSIEEMAWPNGGAEARVNKAIPNELSVLSKDLEKLNANDENEVKKMRDRLFLVKDGPYTFSFNIVNSEGDYYFAENEPIKIILSSEEALGLLRCEHDIANVFKDICEMKYDEEFINCKAKSIGIADEYDNYTYSNEDEDEDEGKKIIKSCIDSWVTVIQKILDGEITEDNLEHWLWYFENQENFEEDIEDWLEDLEQYWEEED